MEPLEQLQGLPADRYRPVRELGRGGMAVVYLAEDVKHRRQVAIKVLRPDIAASVGHDRFLQEINLAASLQHPHILPLYDSGTFESGGETRLYYVMPYVEGETLRDLVHREGELPVGQAMEIACEILGALGYAHAQGIVHRDIKPENILLSGGHALVADFGIARALGEASGTRLTAQGTIVGTPSYMSPEQVAGEREVDGRSDLYSLACILYEMLCGEPPFTGHTAQAIMVKRLTDTPPAIRRLRPVVPEALEAVLTRGLARAPADRFANAAEFKAALQDCRSISGSTPVPAASPRHRVRKLAWTALAIAGLVAVGLLLRGEVAGASKAAPRLVIAEMQALNGDTSTEYLQFGIPEYLASELLRLPGLDVMPMSMVRLDSNRSSPVELGKKFGATHVLASSLRRIGDRATTRFELVELPAGRLVWTAQFDTNSAAFAPAIVAVIADSLHLSLGTSGRRGAIDRSTLDPVTLDKLLRGFYLFFRGAGDVSGDSAMVDSARVLFEQVLERAPGTPRAIVGIGSFYTLAYIRGWDVPGMTQQEVYARGDSIISLALDLDSTLSWAWNFRAVRQLYVEDNFDAAAQSVRRALAADSGNAESYRMRGILRQEIDGDIPGALTDFRHAVALGGVSLRWNSLAAGLMAARQYQEAAAVLERSMAEAPSKHSRTRLLAVYEHLGRREDATRLRREFDSTGQAAAPFEAALAAHDTAAYAQARRDELRRMADSLIHRLKNPPPDAPPAERMVVAEGPIAAILCELGDPARAMDLVEQLHSSRPARLRWIVTNVDLGCLRQDPRYLPMVKAAGLEKYLRN